MWSSASTAFPIASWPFCEIKGRLLKGQSFLPWDILHETQIPDKINTWNIWSKTFLWPRPHLQLQRTHIRRFPLQRPAEGRGRRLGETVEREVSVPGSQ